MRLLKEIAGHISAVNTVGLIDGVISSIHSDSQGCKSDSLFVAVRGSRTDGHRFIDQAIQNGAIAVVCEQIPQTIASGITYLQVANSADALGLIASGFYGNPSSSLKVIGVTGTNGKTTIVNLLYELAGRLGYNAGMLSTIENRIGDERVNATHTTPDPIQLNMLLAKMVEAGCKYCFMEVSSHAVEQRRINGLSFTGGVFTNLTHDHLDYHRTFGAYLQAKKKFFDDLPAGAFALTNVDDRNGSVMVQNSNASRFTYGLKKPADFKGKVIENNFGGLHLNINGKEIWSMLVGRFNAYNLLAVAGVTVLCGEEEPKVFEALSALKMVEGRFDYVRLANNITGIVDYAHTPDALKNVLETINSIRTMNESLITVFGAGGDRDQSKRPEMGKITARLSTKVIVTSDNPRFEDPEMIIRQIMTGVEPMYFNKVITIMDRKEAIKTACMLAQPGDIILVAGKGHEKYQDTSGIKLPFDDKELLTGLLKMKANIN